MHDYQIYPKANKLVREARLELDRLHRLMKESAILLQQLSRESIRESRMMLSLIESGSPVHVPLTQLDSFASETNVRRP
jgi:hypothetical protein